MISSQLKRFSLNYINKRYFSSGIHSSQYSNSEYIKNFKNQNVVETLKNRGYIYQLTGSEDELIKLTTQKKVSVYAGFDPTADSLHIGNLLTMMVLFHFKLHGNNSIALIGGATGMIGDPSGKSTERPILETQFIQDNSKHIKNNLESILGQGEKGFGNLTILNNYDWCKDLSIISFLRDVGKYFRVGPMIKRDFIQNRIDSDGISFTEFTYSLFQANDFLHLNQTQDCQIQVGGSDQWGNITDGCDLVKKKLNKQVYGMTIPLLTNSQGKKLGKSEGNSIWLSSHRTSPYQFYQYWIQVSDEDVEKLLKLFTLLPLEEIHSILQKHKESPHLRLAQRVIAERVTELVHGQEGLEEALNTTKVLFGDQSLEDLSKQQNINIESIFSKLSHQTMDKSKHLNQSKLISLFSEVSGQTKNQCKTLLTTKSLYLNNQVLDSNRTIQESDLIGNFIYFKSGKKDYYIIKFT
ncbi:tyrosine-tRNA ligase [Tieghemostelium lacteum]|uniref:Tyrosine--tRNA ligase n=1 Tax=Tieghemostelium lacteum TaxID=361077 RepID=A0A152A996_TIELA|nr:tyrosine-tRNA ligase [Tieghemostelium lacteum]|eukprot:KYR02701.1 tyrosine-tRNA ligase [Tieghemostelium lacteum]